jgi:predicted aldo/keto reductase-like oxidoreductase
MERREFIKAAAIAAAASTLPGESLADTGGAIPQRTLGRTRAQVSAIGLGGYHIGVKSLTDKQATQIIRTAIDNGITFMDNSWDYNDGNSEVRMGRALKDGYREKVFLMTKIDGRTPDAARSQLEDSMMRLQVDHIDLVQIHEVIRPTDPEQAFRPGYVVDVLRQARQDGKIRFIGFTGHKSPEIHLKMIETAARNSFTFDTVQMPLNLLDAHFDSFAAKVIPVARKKHMGIIGMKPMAGGVVFQSDTVTGPECLKYAMSLPVSVTLTGCESMENLNQALAVARGFQPLDQTQIAALLQKTAAVAQAGKYEQYKTTHNFDGTIQHPQYLG